MELTWPVRLARLADLPFTLWALGAVGLTYLVTAVVGLGDPRPTHPQVEQLRSEVAALSAQVHDLESEVELRDMEAQRLRTIHEYSGEFRVPANLATKIYDIALAEGIDPTLGFNLVRVESGFRRAAVSPKGAVGYSQVLPSTAKWLDPGVETRELFDTETNLHLGFRYLHYLLQEYNGDTRLALLAYNRGPSRVGGLLQLGIDPSNGYAKAVLGE